MENIVEEFKKEVKDLNIQNLSASLLGDIKIKISSKKIVKLCNIANINIENNSTTFIEAKEKETLPKIHKAIANCKIHASISAKRKKLKITFTQVNKEKKILLVKKMKEYTEKYKIAIRLNRNKKIKKIRDKNKKKELSNDVFKNYIKLFNNETKKSIEKIQYISDTQIEKIMKN